MAQLAKLIRSKYPGEYDDMDDDDLEKAVLAKHPEYEDLAVEEEKESPLSKLYGKITTPLIPQIEKGADWLANKIDPRIGDEATPIRSFLAGSVQGVGDVLSQMTSPLDLAATATGVGAIKRGSQGLRRLTQALSAPIAYHGGSEVIRPDATLGERGMGLAELAGGAAGMHFPASALKPRVPNVIPEVNPQKLLPPGRFTATADGIIAAPGDRLPSREIPYRAEDSYSTANSNMFDSYRKNALKQIRERKLEPRPLDQPSNIPIDLSEGFTPLAAKAEGGKVAIGADVKSLGKVLGTSLYKGDIAPIATKELLQNSIDAIRHLGTEGKVNVWLNQEDKFIEVSDNGKGLTRNEIETVFTDLGASGKRSDESAVGGFGLAKAAPLLGGKSVEVVTVAKNPKTGKLMEVTFKGTPDELIEGVNLNEREVPFDTPTGTKVRTYVPDDADFYTAKRFVRDVSQHSDMGGSINLESLPVRTGKIPAFMPIEKGSKRVVASLKNTSGAIDIGIPGNASIGSHSMIEIKLMNNGMYQGTKNMYFNDNIPGIPDVITVDVKSKVPEGHTDYPFTANRENLRGSVDELVKKYIQDNVVNPSIGKRVDELTRLYTSMPEMTLEGGIFPGISGKKIALYDPKGQLDASDLDSIKKNPAFINLTKNISQTIDNIMKTMNEPIWTERLEKVGIIFSDNLHGIHIPNPATKKSAVLINPFISIGNMTPDEAAANIAHTILHEVAHVSPSSPGHNEAFTIRLGDIYGRFGARKYVAAQDEILKSITDPNTGEYNSEIQDVLHRYQDSRGRAGTIEDLLTGTGIGSTVKGGGKGNVSKPSKPNGGRTPLQSTVTKLLSNMESLKGLREEQEAIYRKGRAERFAEFGAVKEGGMSGAKKALSKLKGEFDKVEGDALKMKPQEVNTLFNAIKAANITNGEKARGFTALLKILEGGPVPQRGELRILNDVFGVGFAEKIIEVHGGIGAVDLKMTKTANTMKAMMSSVDASGPLRQGLGLIHRKEWRDAFVEMFKYMSNKEYFETAMADIKKRPTYLLGREAGLFIAEPKDLLKSEEAFANSYVHALPLIRDIVEFSERGYTGFLNKLRADTFDSLLKQSKLMGHEAFTVAEHKLDDGTVKKTIVTSKVADNIAKYINVSTGRGGLGKLEKMAPQLNTVLWSPRLISSRLTILNPKYYHDMDPFTRKEAIKSLFAIAAAGVTMSTLGALAGGKTRGNPIGALAGAEGADTNLQWNDMRSSDFGKVRFGNKVFDPWGGFQQPIVAAARIIAGANEIESQTRGTTISRYAQNKLSPAAGLVNDLLWAKEFIGEGTNRFTRGISGLMSGKGEYTDQYNNKKTIPAEVAKRFAPIFIQDVVETIQEDPSFAEAVGLSIPAFLGAGLQDYPERSANRTPAMRKLSLSQ